MDPRTVRVNAHNFAKEALTTPDERTPDERTPDERTPDERHLIEQCHGVDIGQRAARSGRIVNTIVLKAGESQR